MKQDLIAKSLLAGTGVSENDAARLTLEAIETLGELSTGTSRPELVTLLRRVIQAGVAAVRAADVNAQDDLGRTPLYLAAFYNQPACMQLLLSTPGINVNLPSTTDGNTPIHEAAEDDGPANCLRLLLQAPGIKVNEKDEDGSSPLQLALDEPAPDIFTLLLAQPEIDVNARNEDGATVLHIAALNDLCDCVRQLLAAPGININAWDGSGNTPLDMARSNRKSVSADLILQAGGMGTTTR